MRETITAGILLITLCAAPRAWADFVVAGQPSVARATTQPEDKPAPSPLPTEATETESRPRFAKAQGFGDDVPLHFAVRQIVPRAVKVHYGPGVDPDAVVTWKGGQGWNWVLFHAVHPLGLRLVMTPMAVEIRK